ncbi:MAG: sigma-70 family RNA polymerase sigma factor [Terracidiphilus sp.]
MRVLVRGDQFDGRARFETWLFTIARNLVIDQSRKRTMNSLDELIDGVTEDDRSMQFEVVSDDPTPFDHVSNIEDREKIAAALLQIDTLHREVLVLRFHEELSLEEIAKVTRAPPFHRQIPPLSRPRHDQAPAWLSWRRAFRRAFENG